MEKSILTPSESFTIIDKAISNFKINYRESAQIFLLWGWILTLASFSNFVILKLLRDMEAYQQMGLYSLSNWGIFTLAGFIMFYFLDRRMNREKKVYSYLDNHMKNLWTVTAISFGVAVFLCIKLEINPPAIMLLIAGLATTTSGLLIKFKPMVVGGVAFFAFSVASTYVALGEYKSLLVSAAIVVGYLIPGYLLKSSNV